MANRNIGVTGTRKGLTPQQQGQARTTLHSLRNRYFYFHQGCCVGADEELTLMALTFQYEVIGHPSEIKSFRSQIAWNASDELMTPTAYEVRNQNIVDHAEILIACPLEAQEDRRSGTWQTVRFARKLTKAIIIIYPNGNTEMENF